MPDVSSFTLLQWVGFAAGVFAAGYVAGLTRAYLRRLVSVA